MVKILREKKPFYQLYEAGQSKECQWTSGISTSYPVCAVPSAVDMRASLPLKVEKLINIMAVEQVPFGKGIMIIYTWRTRHHRTEMLSFCLLGKPRKAM